MKKVNKTPNLFIIGAPKCGTTSMIHYLSQHPNVFVSPIKEPHYFNFDSGHRYYFNSNDYLNLFSEAKEHHKYRCEGSVWYMYSEVAIDEMLKFNPEAKFIVMLRNPVSMFFSLHQELLFGGSEDVTSPIEAWELQEERKNNNKIPIGCSDPRLLQYGEVCKLGKQALRVTSKLPANNIKFVVLDDVKKNPDKTFNSILEFLKVTPLHLDNYDTVNKKKVRKYPLLSKLFIFITNLKKKAGIKGGLGIANIINKHNINHNTSISSENFDELQPILMKYFEEDIVLLETVINKDLSHWKKAD